MGDCEEAKLVGKTGSERFVVGCTDGRGEGEEVGEEVGEDEGMRVGDGTK